MKKLLLYSYLLISPSFAFADEIVAVLDLKFEKETKDVAAWMCYDEKEEDCHPWAYFYVFNATVKKVVSGELNKKKIKVIWGHHALGKKNHKNIAVILSKLEEPTGAEYQIREVGKNKAMYCFSDKANTLTKVRLESDKTDLRCYEQQ